MILLTPTTNHHQPALFSMLMKTIVIVFKLLIKSRDFGQFRQQQQQWIPLPMISSWGLVFRWLLTRFLPLYTFITYRTKVFFKIFNNPLKHTPHHYHTLTWVNTKSIIICSEQGNCLLCPISATSIIQHLFSTLHLEDMFPSSFH